MFNYTNAFSGISVDSIPDAKEFYGNKLGLKITDAMGGFNMHLNEGAYVFVYGKEDHAPATYTALNFIVADVEKAVDELAELGVKFEIYQSAEMQTDNKGIMRGQGPDIAWFKDPAGNFLSVLSVK